MKHAHVGNDRQCSSTFFSVGKDCEPGSEKFLPSQPLWAWLCHPKKERVVALGTKFPVAMTALSLLLSFSLLLLLLSLSLSLRSKPP